MEDYDQLMAQIRDTAGKLKELQDLAFEQYSLAVEGVLTNHLTDETQIEHLLDGIMDFGDDPRFIALMKKLCRHVYYRYPQLAGDYVHFFRLLFEENTSESEEV